MYDFTNEQTRYTWMISNSSTPIRIPRVDFFSIIFLEEDSTHMLPHMLPCAGRSAGQVAESPPRRKG